MIKWVYGFAVLLGIMTSCNNSESKNSTSPRTKVDTISKVDTSQWIGVYQGTVPSPNSISLQMKLNLLPSNTYELDVVHLKKDPNNNNKKESFRGEIHWADDSTTIELKEMDSISNKFRIKPGMVEYLNPDATPNTGELAEFYVLKKKN